MSRTNTGKPGDLVIGTGLRWKRVGLVFCGLALLALLTNSIGRKLTRGRHWVWKNDSEGPWLSFPPVEFGFHQDWLDFSRSDPPGFMPDGYWSRKCWDELHHMTLLSEAGKKSMLTESEVEELANLACYPDEWYVRSQALWTLSASKVLDDFSLQQKLIGVFSRHLLDPQWQVRTAAAYGLAKLKAREKMAEVIKLIRKDCEAGEFHALVHALGAFSEGLEESALGSIPGIKEAVPILASGLRDADEYERVRVAYVLGAIGPNARNALPNLREALASAEEEDTRNRAQRGIVRYGKYGTLTGALRQALQRIRED
jgi:hypothetical protein